MSQQILQVERIPVLSQELQSESVPEPVAITFGRNSGTFLQSRNRRLNAIHSEGLALFSDP